MPFVQNMQSPDENQPNPSQGPVSPSGGGGAISTGAPTAGAGGTTAGKVPSPAGGGFASLDKYLTANMGQAQPLANQITSGITNQYNTLQGQNQAALSGINQQVTNAPGYTAGGQDVLAAEAANPVSFANAPGNVQRFQSLMNNAYTGPLSAENTPGYTAQQNAINQAISTGQTQTGTEAGREQLLSQNEAAPTAGVTALNSAILSQDPNALGSIQNAYQPFQNLLTGLQGGASNINKQIAQQQANAKATNAQANQQITNQVNALNTDVQNQLTSAQNAVNAYNATVPGYSGALNNINQALSLWNGYKDIIPNFEIDAVAAANPTTGITAPTAVNAPTLQQVATPQQYQQAAAFQNLLSGLNSSLVPVISPTTANQAGTFTVPAQLTSQADLKAQAIKNLNAANAATVKKIEELKNSTDPNAVRAVGPLAAQELAQYNSILSQLQG